MKKDKSKDSEHIIGLMEVSILEIGKIIRLMELGSISGKTAESTMEAGKIMIWTVWAYTFILMVLLMKVNTKTTRKQDTVSTIGLMVVNMKAGGIKASNMASVFTKIQPRTR
jgi:hypothetical protein